MRIKSSMTIFQSCCSAQTFDLCLKLLLSARIFVIALQISVALSPFTKMPLLPSSMASSIPQPVAPITGKEKNPASNATIPNPSTSPFFDFHSKA